MELLLASAAVGFVSVLAGTPYARRYLLDSGIFAVDQQKEEKPRLPTSGGIPVLFGFLLSLTTFLGLSTFLNGGHSVESMLAALSSVTIITLIGLIDDIHIRIEAVIEEDLDIDGEEIELEIHRVLEETEPPHRRLLPDRMLRSGGSDQPNMIRDGLGQVSKMVFVLPAALPLIAVGAGSYTMHFPFVGTVEWGLLYPLLLLPLGLLFVSNVVNMLEGMNGLGASLTAVTSLALGAFAWMNGEIEAAAVSFFLAACLAAFLRYNFYPASILPGDSLTYLCGAAMFSAIVLGDMEKFAVAVFPLWYAEFLLKARSGFRARSWGELQDDGSLRPHRDGTYSLTHPLMRMGLSERGVTLALTAVQTLICAAALLAFGWP